MGKLEELQAKLDRYKKAQEAKNEEKPKEEEKPKQMTEEEEQEMLSRSICVGSLDYSTTQTQFEKYFSACGKIVRATIAVDKLRNKPKGFGYIEFATKDGADTALQLDGQVFNGRNLKISRKRKNIPGMGRNSQKRRKPTTE